MLDPIVGAALYFDPAEAGPITPAWLDEAVRLLAASGVPVREFDIAGTAAFSEKLTQPYPPNRDGLRAALAAEPARALHLYCHATRPDDLVLRWQASAGIGRDQGYVFLGLPAVEGVSPAGVLAAAHGLARLVAPCRYGIGYLRSAHEAPSFYAKGMLGRTAEIPETEDLETQDRIFRWFGELRRGRRHLRGAFRSVYPAQLVSAAHRRARVGEGGPTVAELGLGTWTPAEGGLWLWELGPDELPAAREALGRAGVLLAA